MARAVLLFAGMAGTVHDPYTVIPARDGQRIGSRARDWAMLVVLAVALIAVLAAAVSGVRSERQVSTLPAAARSALFTRTVDDLRQFCRDGRPYALEAHCRELASFAAEFDECTDECRVLVRPHLAPRPTR